MYTPTDMSLRTLIKEDRPYAGVLYLSLGVYGRASNHQDFSELTVGLVGPGAGGEESQKFIHRTLGNSSPRGWQHQLKNEPVFAWIYERKWKTLRKGMTGGWGFELIPHWSGGLGNLPTYTGGGAQARWGLRLPDDFGAQLTRPGGFQTPGIREKGPISFYLNAGVDGKVVLRNIFLDGNTYRESHSVEKIPLTGDLFVGFGVRAENWQLRFQYVFWTKRFKSKSGSQLFGIVDFSYAF
jgi:hypothetical protein